MGDMMAMTDVFDDARVCRLLAGTDVDIAHALTLINNRLRNRLCGWLRKRFRRLRSDDLASAWADTLLGVLQAIRAGRFDANRPVLPWICRIAYARAVDRGRRAHCHQKTLENYGQMLRETGIQRHEMAIGPDEQHEVVGLVHEAIAMLPTRQQLVLQVFVEHYPESRAMEVLRDEVGARTGRVETLAAVKRALQEARATVRTFLRRKGYSIGQRGDA
jgi:DNA-directed RNA polymerase specialized sigma24 family protein